MPATYNPKTYTGEHYGEIFSAILAKNTTLSKGIRLMDNIKYEQIVTTMAGSITVQDYKVNASVADAAGSLSFGDATVRPVKKMVLDVFEFETLRNSRFSEDMLAGAANVESNEFLRNVLAFYETAISNSLDNMFWSEVATDMAANAGSKIVGAVLTASNLDEEFAKVYAGIDIDVLNSGDVKIFADKSIYKLVNQANLAQTYRDIFTVSGGEHFYLGIKIEYVPLGANKMIAGRPSDFVWATDLISDMGSIEVNKVDAISDNWFLKAVFTLDTAVVVPTQKVYYSA